MIGKVKFFNTSKGYGFITDENGNDIYVHISNVNTSEKLFNNQTVSFSVKEAKVKKGTMEAYDVVIIG